MEHSSDSSGLRLTDDRAGILFSLSRVHNDRLPQLAGQGDLRRECGALSLAGRIVVVIVESALPYRYGRIRDKHAKLRDVSLCVEGSGVVGVDPRCCENKV